MRTLLFQRHLVLASVWLGVLFSGFSRANASEALPMHSGEISAAMDRLKVVGSVLYVAAHPDDENTRFLAWLVGSRGLRAGYLSLTRGDGGQNLIGTEQDALLGLVRTQELLAARRLDGAEQFFTRARDLGFSKTAQETLSQWGRDAVLDDVVRTIRRFRPDVIVTRFTTQPPNHGHHTASAILAAEAFDAAADASRFSQQLSDVGVWKADRLLHNVSTWNLPPQADMSGYLKLDVGGYEPRLGRSWGELAAESRSQHKSQGFGVAAERGPLLEYFTPLAGTRPSKDIFDGLDFSWKRYPGTEALRKALDDVTGGFDPKAPERSLAGLSRVRAALAGLPNDNPWKAIKLRDVDALMVACAGLYIEARAPQAAVAVPGEDVSVELSVTHRSSAVVQWLSASIPGAPAIVPPQTPLQAHQPVKNTVTVTLPANAPISTPYWLRNAPSGGLYSVDSADHAWTGLPVAAPALSASFTFLMAGQHVTLERPVNHVWIDPVRGERSRVLEVSPAMTATLVRDVTLFPNGAPQSVSVVVTAGRPQVSGKLSLVLPSGWRTEPTQQDVLLAERGHEQTFRFRLFPPKGQASVRAKLRVVTQIGAVSESWRVRAIQYEHIPPQTVRQPSEGELVVFPLATSTGAETTKVGYIPGPGDWVAESLSAAGYNVTRLSEERLANEPLDAYDAIVVGVRAFNSNPRLMFYKDKLLRFVEMGGRLLVQYNTNSRVGPLQAMVGPYPLEIGRDRVTDETAAMTPVREKDPLLSHPNRLGPADFEGWVQERGLYFASKWDERYQPLFSMHDEGEPNLLGSVLVAKYGKGRFVYTGLSFFRQLPAGVPGAYRLFANLIAP